MIDCITGESYETRIETFRIQGAMTQLQLMRTVCGMAMGTLRAVGRNVFEVEVEVEAGDLSALRAQFRAGGVKASRLTKRKKIVAGGQV